MEEHVNSRSNAPLIQVSFDHILKITSYCKELDLPIYRIKCNEIFLDKNKMCRCSAKVLCNRFHPSKKKYPASRVSK